MNNKYGEALDHTSKQKYVDWHEYAYKDDLLSCDALENVSSRNAIVHGYYAMLNAALLYFAKVHNLKINKDHVHDYVPFALLDMIKDKATRDEIKYLIDQAKKEYDIFENKDASYLPAMVFSAKSERNKSSYYRSDDEFLKEKYLIFRKDFVNPFIKIITELKI
ncbi:MAG: hypothetical protein WC781_05425 [Candidatus Pacearchaeota archaeon]